MTETHVEHRILIAYPVVFEDKSDGIPVIGHLRLPKDLAQDEADRVKAMVQALVVSKEETRSEGQ